MKARLSLTVITAAIVLAVGAPGAFGTRLAVSPQNEAVAYFHANELATAATSALPASQAASYFRANELRTAAFGASTRDVTATTSRYSSNERYVVAVALGIGVALGFGLLLVVRVRSGKPIAQ